MSVQKYLGIQSSFSWPENGWRGREKGPRNAQKWAADVVVNGRHAGDEIPINGLLPLFSFLFFLLEIVAQNKKKAVKGTSSLPPLPPSLPLLLRLMVLVVRDAPPSLSSPLSQAGVAAKFVGWPGQSTDPLQRRCRRHWEDH